MIFYFLNYKERAKFEQSRVGLKSLTEEELSKKKN